MLSRRDFMLRTSSLVSLSPLAPMMLSRTARAAGAEPDAKTLVVIQLDGGNDGLNTVVPYADQEYPRLRPKLHVAADRVLKLDDHVGLHPQMSAAKKLFDDGRLAIVQGVGYPNPDRSHFNSMRIWQTASFDPAAFNDYGWLGRALDRRLLNSPPAISGAPAAEPSIVYIGEEQLPVALWARRAEAMSLTRLDDLALQSAPGRISPPAAVATDVQQFVSRQMLSAYGAADELTRRTGSGEKTSDATYPDSDIAGRLRLISQLIQSGSQARVYYATLSGFDTHAAQEFTHANLLDRFSQALAAFLDDLRGAGLAERVVVLAFSEFGRRAAENDSLGTDHGAAAPVFVAGQPVRGGLIGGPPNLQDLVGGDVMMGVDFRQVYATLMQNWLGVPAQEILGQSFEMLPLIA